MTTCWSTWPWSTCWRRRAATGARLLYSDEDKIDAGGTLQEPAFKPDWNYRLLLGVNYVCHLTMVDRATLLQAGLPAKPAAPLDTGPLDPEFDGAQDHDLLLRLAEILPDRRIHHVPEILYHWRMSANSTAASIGNKSYAITAGCNAIAAHLARRNLPAAVHSREDMTLYKIDWTFSASPRVTIIVPFKDEPETTQRCLDALLTRHELSRLRHRAGRQLVADAGGHAVLGRCR